MGAKEWTTPWSTEAKTHYGEQRMTDVRFQLDRQPRTHSQVKFGTDKWTKTSNVQDDFVHYGRVPRTKPAVETWAKNASKVNFGEAKVRYVTEQMDQQKSINKRAPQQVFYKMVARYDLINGHVSRNQTNGFDFWNPNSTKQRTSANFTELPPDGSRYNPINGRVMRGTIF